MLRTGECWTCPSCGAWRELEARTWVGVACKCGEETPVVAAVLGGGVYRNPRMRLPMFTRWQMGEVERILGDGVDCPRCGAVLEREEVLVVWVPPPADLEALRYPADGGGA